MPKNLMIILILLCQSLGAAEINGLTEYIEKDYPYYEEGLTYSYDNCQISLDSHFSCLLRNNRDSGNSLVFGKLDNGNISNVLVINDNSSILTSRFLKNASMTFLEVFASTSKGNGGIHLYDVSDGKLNEIFYAHAVDAHGEMEEAIKTKSGQLHDFNWDDPRKNPRGTLVERSRYFSNCYKLSAHYKDQNHDGLKDLVLEGEIILEIDEQEDSRAKLKRVFYWSKEKTTFIEDKYQRVGPSYYFKKIDGVY